MSTSIYWTELWYRFVIKWTNYVNHIILREQPLLMPSSFDRTKQLYTYVLDWEDYLTISSTWDTPVNIYLAIYSHAAFDWITLSLKSLYINNIRTHMKYSLVLFSYLKPCVLYINHLLRTSVYIFIRWLNPRIV